MTIEQVVDDYLIAVRRIIGTSPAPNAATPASPPPTFPDLTWTGDAHRTAIAATAQLQHARSRLQAAADGVATSTQTAREIAADATTHLTAITTEWEHAKTAAIGLPNPANRDAALLPHAQHTINDAVALITATTAKYSAAADDVRKHTASLPTPKPGDDTATPGPAPAADTGPADSPLAPTPELPPTAALNGAAPAGLDPATASAMLPSAMGAAMGLPGTFLPMASALPSTAAVPLGGLLSPLLQNASPSPAGDANRDPTTGPRPGNHHHGQPGSIDEAIDAALDALGITDPQARENWREGYEVLIHRESSDRPDAINNGDSNATGPLMQDGGFQGSSRGLTQVTPSTFHSFHVPGTSDDIFDPVANIAASMRYVMHTHHVSPSGADLTSKVAQANASSAGGGY